jgi:hypothetical protein
MTLGAFWGPAKSNATMAMSFQEAFLIAPFAEREFSLFLALGNYQNCALAWEL